MPTFKKILLEALADYAHEAWSGWMRYLFSKSQENPDGTVTIPKWAVDRWRRQLRTPYRFLTEDEKNSDRAEAMKILDLFKAHCGKELFELVEYVCEEDFPERHVNALRKIVAFMDFSEESEQEILEFADGLEEKYTWDAD